MNWKNWLPWVEYDENDTKDSSSEGVVIEGEDEGRIIVNESENQDTAYGVTD